MVDILGDICHSGIYRNSMVSPDSMGFYISSLDSSLDGSMGPCSMILARRLALVGELELKQRWFSRSLTIL